MPFIIIDRFFAKAEKQLDIYCPNETKQKVEALLEIGFPGDFKNIEEEAKVNFIDSKDLKNKQINQDTTVTSFEVEHGKIKPCYGYVLNICGKYIGFSGDSSYCQAIEEIVKQSNLAVLDMSLIEGNKSHMGINDIEKIAKKYPNKTIVTTHMKNKTKVEAKNLSTKNLIIPEDGEIITI